jgi:outer membrane protein OmpA-like peptidoglycan-associated protein
MRLKPVGKLVILILVAGFVFGGYRLATRGASGPGLLERIAPAARVKPSAVPPKADLPNVDANPSEGGITPVSANLPGSEPGCTDKTEVRLLHWAWNAHMGLMLANGGPQATGGSLMCKRGVNLKLTRQDDAGKMQEALVAFATELSRGNPQPTKGAHFVTIMGDGGAQFLKGVNDTLKRLGPGYTAKVVGAIGYSRGEDKFMGPAAWKRNPEAARGGVVAGYLRDGDWNIALKWLGDNGLPNNPDEKTYDPDALNWIAANDYIDAAEKYVAGYSEERPVVRNGKRTGQTKRIKVDGIVTWTPGDVTAAQKKGGLVSIVSTKEYSSQMPCILIGIDKWMRDNRPIVEGLLQAALEGGDAVKASPQALRRAAQVSAAVYQEQGADAAYWEKYYKGVTEPDKQGNPVELGGSSVNNLADALLAFGLAPGSANLFAATYEVFGDLVVNQYPELVPNYPPVREILDTSYLQALAKRMAPRTTTTAAVARATPRFEASRPVRNVVSRRAWNIRFEPGRAAFSPGTVRDLERLRRDLLVASGTTIEIHGHTDSQGNPAANLALSEARAFAVQQWLEKKFPVNFPKGRVRVFAHGQQNPVAPNNTPQGRAQNRRVEVVLGTS